MRASILTLLLSCFMAMPAFAKPPEVVVFGASWCGPCRSLKGFLAKQGVPHEYKDIDNPQNLADYERAARGERGIPLTVVNDRDHIRGFAPERIMAAIGRTDAQKAVKHPAGTKLYGGKTPEEWQREFRELRAYHATLEARAEQLDKVANYEDEEEQVKSLRKRATIAEDSLFLLDSDASRYALPRKFRQ